MFLLSFTLPDENGHHKLTESAARIAKVFGQIGRCQIAEERGYCLLDFIPEWCGSGLMLA